MDNEDFDTYDDGFDIDDMLDIDDDVACENDEVNDWNEDEMTDDFGDDDLTTEQIDDELNNIDAQIAQAELEDQDEVETKAALEAEAIAQKAKFDAEYGHLHNKPKAYHFYQQTSCVADGQYRHGDGLYSGTHNSANEAIEAARKEVETDMGCVPGLPSHFKYRAF